MEETLSVGLEHTGGGTDRASWGLFSKYSNYLIIIFFRNLSTINFIFITLIVITICLQKQRQEQDKFHLLVLQRIAKPQDILTT